VSPATKGDCRKALQSTLRGTAAQDRAAWSAEIRKHLRSSAVWENARTVMLFAALRYEPDLLPVLEAGGGPRLIFPAMVNDRIQPRVVRSLTDLELSPGGIREPAAHCPLVPPEEIDLILIPGLGFTAEGIRLGRGRGHYDAFLPSLRPEVPRVGTAFHCQLCRALPGEAHDVPVNAVLTEMGWITE
jgi:5-formyltetrahydrofolate cyclo-ligase